MEHISYNGIVEHKSEVMKLSPRTGRPIIGGKKDIDVKVRFDKDTHDKLLSYCEKKGITRTEAIRQSVKLLVEKE